MKVFPITTTVTDEDGNVLSTTIRIAGIDLDVSLDGHDAARPDR